VVCAYGPDVAGKGAFRAKSLTGQGRSSLIIPHQPEVDPDLRPLQAANGRLRGVRTVDDV